MGTNFKSLYNLYKFFDSNNDNNNHLANLDRINGQEANRDVIIPLWSILEIQGMQGIQIGNAQQIQQQTNQMMNRAIEGGSEIQIESSNNSSILPDFS